MPGSSGILLCPKIGGETQYNANGFLRALAVARGSQVILVLAGQQNLSIINNAYGNTTDANVSQILTFGQPGSLRERYATNARRMGDLIKAKPKIPANFFPVNRRRGGVYLQPDQFPPNNNFGSSFGQTTTAYRDSSGTVDPGGRILEWVFRLNF